MNKKKTIQLLPSLSQLFFCKREKKSPPHPPFSPLTRILPSIQSYHSSAFFLFHPSTPHPVSLCPVLVATLESELQRFWRKGPSAMCAQFSATSQNGSGDRRPVVHMNLWPRPSSFWLSNWDIIWEIHPSLAVPRLYPRSKWEQTFISRFSQTYDSISNSDGG